MDSETRANKAYRLAFDFDQKYGECSQATLKALQTVYGKEDDDMFRAIGALAGGGGARCDGSCGAYCAAIFFMGLFTGRNYDHLDANPRDPLGHVQRDQLFALTDKLYQKFIDTYGSINCSDIHRKLYGRAFYLRDSDEIDKFLAQGGHSEKGGPGVCGNAARWAVEEIDNFLEKG
ncbi:MAG: C-GCAxxG-C-C family protein [Actinomycetia bacterium]|nr:C-GCAxxG-C-C family protein [Actinomycetes bacterium]